ncbi:hypothetical protein [Martelella mediterranea]|uniref:Uncharacterized protein n=1 Tax=Martelella mediterranea TaxID=293089 RepID=A0A4R3NM92_9HYPH|nr:hypothetical protein [Martelella mediterranea]TCT36408.1 hypothetical protein EDC90_10218 [Martelella mediterranea]
MWNWFSENATALNALASIFTLLIWAIYLQILVGSYREGHRAKILINRGAGPTLNGRCLIANMSAKAIYIDAVLLDFWLEQDGQNQHHSYSLSNLSFERYEARDPRSKWFQGPLDAGEHIDIGSFHALVETMSPDGFDSYDKLQSIKITVAATYASEDRPVAAERVFDVFQNGSEQLLSPRSYSAHQIRSRRGRRRIISAMRSLHDSERPNTEKDTGAVKPFT